MDSLLAGLLLYTAASCVASAVAFLLAAAVVESAQVPNQLWDARVWLGALLAPHVVGAITVAHAVRLHGLDPIPWSARAHTVRHVSFLWIAEAPDAAYRVKAMAFVAGAVTIAGLLRPFFSAALAWRRSRVLAQVSTPVPEMGIWLTPLDRPWSTCVGFLRTRVYVTSGLAEILESAELYAVIAHEHAHARRRHNLVRLLALGAFGPTIVMPTAHFSLRRLHAALERSADVEATRAGAEAQALASALVKSARKLRELYTDPGEKSLRQRLANRYREEFVVERARLLLSTREGTPHKGPVLGRLSLVIPAVLSAALIALAGPYASPTVRSFFESLLLALSRD